MWPRSSCLTIASTRARVSHGGLGSRPAKNMLYSASSCRNSTSNRFKSRSISVGSFTRRSPRNQKPDKWQPELPGVGHGAVVDEHFGRVARSDDLKQVPQL